MPPAAAASIPCAVADSPPSEQVGVDAGFEMSTAHEDRRHRTTLPKIIAALGE